MSSAAASASLGIDDLESFRTELVGFCYRMLASIHDAEDAVQETMARAWRASERFEDRGGVRPWLYRIATNVCIDVSKGRSRRALPVDLSPAGTAQDRLGEPRSEATWVQPAPDDLVVVGGDPADTSLDSTLRYARRAPISCPGRRTDLRARREAAILRRRAIPRTPQAQALLPGPAA